mmetsp:Transcript_136038/g.434316  ORF Transcript_136038/g.434316 Transcript_136038/m.434316 type:complete len:317 (+) Transcript_136038:87-1037(+)
MATIRRPSKKDQSGWDILGAAGARIGAYLIGQYNYSFSNASGRTVKLHLVDDTGAPGGAGRQDYFLTVPGNAEGVEVPMKSNMIVVTAGFFMPEDGTYEIFWENRRFSWESELSICVAARHSVDANRVCTDVFPGAPEVPRGCRGGAPPRGSAGTGQRGGGQLKMLPDNASPTLEGLKLFSLRPKGAGGSSSKAGGGEWQSCELKQALPDGSLEVSDSHTEGSRSLRLLQPLREPSLLLLPPGIIRDFFGSTVGSQRPNPEKLSAISDFSDFGLPPPHLRHPRDKIQDIAGSFVSSYATFSTMAPSPAGTPANRQC